MRITTKNKDVPLCECFEVEEEYIVASAESSTNSCVLQVSLKVNFLSFTMMKSVISSSTLGETKNFWIWYKKHLTDRGLLFLQKEKPVIIPEI